VCVKNSAAAKAGEAMAAAPCIDWMPESAPRCVRIQVDTGFVDLAAQVAPFVRRQAAAAALGVGIALLLLAMGVVGCTLVALVEAGGDILALAAAVVTGLLLLWRTQVILVETATVLRLGCRHGDEGHACEYASHTGTAYCACYRRNTATRMRVHFCNHPGVVDVHKCSSSAMPDKRISFKGKNAIGTFSSRA
jgi:hypothetical protein